MEIPLSPFAGFDVVEFAAAKDNYGISALTISRIVLNIIGGLARAQTISSIFKD